MRLRATRLSSISGSSRRLWTPALLGSALALWLDAGDSSTITLNAGNVNVWADKSGNGRNASQGVAAKQPALASNVINGKPVVRGDGSDDILEVSNGGNLFQNISSGTIILIGRYSRTNSSDLFIAIATPSASIRASLGAQTSGNAHRAGARRLDAQGQIVASGGTVVSNTPIIQRGDYNYSGGTIAVAVDGTQLGTASFTGGNTDNTLGASTVLFGFGSAFYPMDIGEVIVANAALTTADRQRLEGYLAYKWGLQANLPSNHPFRNAPPFI